MARCSLTVLGSGSGMPQAHRACSGYLLDTGGALDLFDCGSGVVSSLLRCGFDPQRLGRVFISHTHSDHISDLTLLIQMLHGQRSTAPLSVYVPGEFVTPLNDLLRAVYLFPEKLSLPLTVIGVGAGQVRAGDVAVTAIANTHQDAQVPWIERLGLRNKGQSFSFRIDAAGKSILYSADLGSLDDIQPHLHDVDLCLIETTHIDLERLWSVVATTPQTQFVLTHLGLPAETRPLSERLAALELSNARLAEDGLRIDLGTAG